MPSHPETTTIESLIGLHRLIERSRRRRWLFVLLVVLLALLLAMVAFHSFTDTAAPADGGLVCGFVVVLLVATVAFVARPVAVRPPSRRRSRAPPASSPAPPSLRRPLLLVPLRL